MRPLLGLVLLLTFLTLVIGEKSSLEESEKVVKKPLKETVNVESISKVRGRKEIQTRPQRLKPKGLPDKNDNDYRKPVVKGKKEKPKRPQISKPNRPPTRKKSVDRKPVAIGDPRKRELQNRSKQER